MAKCITNISSTNHLRTQLQMINDSSGGGREVCKSIDEVKTLGKINVFMLMTASIDDTLLLFITLTAPPLPSLQMDNVTL